MRPNQIWATWPEPRRGSNTRTRFWAPHARIEPNAPGRRCPDRIRFWAPMPEPNHAPGFPD
eukprot:5264672-Prymnesium_polylepis.1